jgi:hypothetical protein
MIDDEDIQQTLIARLKANAALVALLTSGGASEIREDQWQGRDFSYPCVRIDIVRQVPILKVDPCEWSRVEFIAHSFSEKDSSNECVQVASAIRNSLHRKGFAGVGSPSFRFFFCHVTSVEGAKRASERVWRSGVVCQSDLYKI